MDNQEFIETLLDDGLDNSTIIDFVETQNSEIVELRAKLAAMESQDVFATIVKYSFVNEPQIISWNEMDTGTYRLYAKPVPADKPAARITERDAWAIINACDQNPLEPYSRWLPALLNKLNADREQVPAVAVPDSVISSIEFALDAICTETVTLVCCGRPGQECCGSPDVDWPSWATEATTKLASARELLLAASPSHSQQSAEGWLPVSTALPPEGEPFQAFHESWIDEDFNIYGIRECHRYGDGTQYASAKWFDHQDCWVEDGEVPQLWRPYVKPDRCPSHESEGGNKCRT